MEIKRADDKYYIGDSEEDTLAEMTFILTGDSIITIDHTYVSEDLSGQGVAKKLLDRLITDARKENKKIVPICPFAKEQMEKNDDYKDMIHK